MLFVLKAENSELKRRIAYLELQLEEERERSLALYYYAQDIIDRLRSQEPVELRQMLRNSQVDNLDNFQKERGFDFS